MRFNRFQDWVLQHPIIALLVATLILSVLYSLIYLIYIKATFDKLGLLNGVFGGVLASLITYALVRYFFLQQTTYGFKQWLHFGSAKTWVIPSYLEHPDSRSIYAKYYVVPPFDAQAGGIAVQLLRRCGYRYPHRKILGSHHFDPEVLKENLVIFCIPQRNQYSRLFLGLYNEIYLEHRNLADVTNWQNVNRYLEDIDCQNTYFGLQCIRRNAEIDGQELEFLEWQMRHFGMPPGQEWWRATVDMHFQENINNPGNINYDFAMIVKGPNPFNEARSILIVFGIHGIGTLGGSLFLYQNANSLFSSYPHRAQAHLVQIRYTSPPGTNNYVDSEILLPIEHLHYQPLGHA